MLERIWLILIFVLGGLVPPMHAARAVPAAEGETPCAMVVCCADGCSCEFCPCAAEDPDPRPDEREPAVPSQPEREQKRVADPVPAYGDLVGVIGPEPVATGEARGASEARWPVCRRLESVFCVWRI